LGQDEALTKRHEFFLWLALLILAALLRFGPVGAGLPYINYIDEGHVLHPAIELLQARSFDSTRFTYPPLTSYLTIVAAKGYSPIYRLVHHRRLKDDLPRSEEFHTALGDNYDLIAPPEIVVLGRLVVASLSVGTVLVAGALARSIAGARAGLVAMLFAAFSPALVSRSSIAIIDTAAAFFAMVTLYFCQRLRVAAIAKETLLWREAALAGVAAGLAFGGKYTVGLVFVAVIATIGTLRRPLTSKAALSGAAGAGLVMGIFFGVPAALLHPAKIIAELRSQAAFYQSIRSDHGFLSAALLPSEIGLPLLLAGLAGFGLMLLKRETRSVVFTWLVFVAALAFAVTWPSFHPFRNLLPVVPLLCIAAAFLFEQAVRRFDRRVTATIVAALLFTASFGWASVRYVHTRFSRVDSRVLALDWLQRHATKDTNILAVRELAILPGEWKRIPGHAVVVPWSEAADLLQRQRFDYVVTGDWDLRFLPDPDRWSAYRERWATLVAPMPEQASFGVIPAPVVPYLWRTNDERVFILKP
jgi:4-amino-4-deoxy-L-arabinose transferase-like glycosyltransferase